MFFLDWCFRVEGPQKSPEVYHTPDCPLAKDESGNTEPSDPKETDNGDLGNEDANGNVKSEDQIKKSGSVCSCDHEGQSKASEQTKDLTNQNVVAMDTSETSDSRPQGETGSGQGQSSKDSSQKDIDALFVDAEKQLDKIFDTGGESDIIGQSGARNVCDADQTQSTSDTQETKMASSDHVGGDLQERSDSGVQLKETLEKQGASSTVSMETKDNDSTKPAESSVATATDENKPQSQQHGNVMHFHIGDSDNEEGGSGVLGTTPPQNTAPPGTTPTPGKEHESSDPNTPGIFSRTLGSISSIGSSITSHTPHLTKVVDFSSGLFTRNQDARGSVKDFAEVYMRSPSFVLKPGLFHCFLYLVRAKYVLQGSSKFLV